MKTRRELEDELVSLVKDITGETIERGEAPESYLRKIIDALIFASKEFP